MRNFLCPALAILGASVLTAADAGKVTFNRDIRPIMSDTCFRCHGHDKGSRMAGLRLDIREEALKPTRSGKIPIVPGDPDKSEIIERIFASGARIMPPVFAHRELTAKQKDTIRQWVAQGAVYEGHWSYQPIGRPSVPPAVNAALIRNPIDNFVQERLNRDGLAPAAEADKRTLIRRVMLDLTGPSADAEQVHAFLAGQESGRVREACRHAFEIAGLRRAADHALAGCGALCGYLRFPRRQSDSHLAVSRLRAAGFPQ